MLSLLPVVRGTLGVALSLACAMAQRQTADLRALVDATFSGDRAGCVLVARGERELFVAGHGRVRPRGPAVRARTLFDIGSLTETFTAAAIMRLAQDGRLSLDDPLSGHVLRVPRSLRDLTLRHLLQHTSGLPDDVALQPGQRQRKKLFLARVLALRPWGRPGRDFNDNPLDYGLLAAVIENVTGESFDAYVVRALFEPAGLLDTGFVGDDSLDRRRALVRFEPKIDAAPSGSAVEGTYDWSLRGSSGIVSTVRDIATWFRELRDGSLLDEEHRRMLWTADRWDRACGWAVATDGGRRVRVGHLGRAHGFRSLVRFHLDHDVLVVGLAGAGADLQELDRRILDLVSGTATPGAAQWEPRLGRYRIKSGEELDVAFEGGQLVMRSLGQETSARLHHGQPQMPEWPRFYDEIEQRVEVLLRPLLERDADSFARSFHDAAPKDAAASALRLVNQLEQNHGKLHGARIIGTSAAVGLVSYYRIFFGGVPVTLVIEWHGEELERIRQHDAVFPFAVVLKPTAELECTAESLDGEAKLRVEFRADGKRLTLFDVSKRGKRGIRATRMR